MKTKFIIAFVSVLLFAGCDDFFDINNDPNNPTHAELNTILPYTQANMFGTLGIGTSGISELVSVYSHQTVQRGNHDDYKIQANEFSLVSCWEELYSVALPDIGQLIRQGEEEGRPVYAGIGKVMKAHIFSLMVDMWGDLPFAEAGDPTLYIFPHFDSDHDIYGQLFGMIDEGISDLNAGGTGPGSDDLVYGGNIGKWIKYANSLKLNLYNKVRLTDLYDAGAVSSLLSSELISSPNEDFEMTYTTSITPENRNPGFVREYTQNNPQYYISPYFYLLMHGEQACQNGLMTGIVDPRIPYYFYNQLGPGESAALPVSYQNDRFLTIWFGSFDRDPAEGFDQSKFQTLVGLYPVGGAYDNGTGAEGDNTSGLKGASAQRILTAAAVDFIRAELALTANTSDNARTMLQSAMTKSFAKVNAIASTAGAPPIANADITAYTDAVLTRYDAGDNDAKLEIIMTQKWIQEFGFAIESYNDIRRTGYPQVCDPAMDLNDFSIQTNPYPVSLPYSSSDLTNNGNAPAQRNQYTDKVFWDVN